MNDKFLGKKCRDTITGLEGIATLKQTFLNDCVRYCINAGYNQTTGKVINHYVYEQQMELAN